jgi:hypothetical protein
MGSACFPSTASSRFGPVSCSHGFVSRRPFAGMSGIADGVPAFEGRGWGARRCKVCLAGVDRRRQELCHRFGRQSPSHGSLDRPGGVEGVSAHRCVLAVVVKTGSHTSYSEVSS